MCRLCQTKPVYEFTNKRKLCVRCFINYFQKKVFYTIRKFGMVGNGDIIGYENVKSFRGVVLSDVLKMLSEKGNVELVKLCSQASYISGSKQTSSSFSLNNVIMRENLAEPILKQNKSRVKQSKLKINKIAVSSTIDLESGGILNEIIHGNLKKLDNFEPVNKKIIKPLYLFLDKEVLLYAKLKKLKFKKEKKERDEISKFIDESEKKHPEVKRAIVKGVLKMCN